MVNYIKYKDEIIAIILRSDFSKKGASFFTTQEDPFQLGVLSYERGKNILAHKHIEIKRDIKSVSEVLVVLCGKVKVTFYNDDNKSIGFKILKAGDAILMKKLGHGLKLLEDSKIIEIKQGPYLGKENDKEYLSL